MYSITMKYWPALLVGPGVEDLHDVGVDEPRRRLRLALEARDERRVLGEVLGEQLDRDAALEAQVEGEVHGRHAAEAEPALERGSARRSRRCSFAGFLPAAVRAAGAAAFAGSPPALRRPPARRSSPCRAPACRRPAVGVVRSVVRRARRRCSSSAVVGVVGVRRASCWSVRLRACLRRGRLRRAAARTAPSARLRRFSMPSLQRVAQARVDAVPGSAREVLFGL